MSQPVHLEVFYPHPPERVWQVLTDRRALAAWMMENDFEPKVGHKFRFYSQPLPGLETSIQCEVVELEEPNRLVYTWKESTTAEPSLVVWTLSTVAGGTQLRLKHHQYSYTAAVAALNSGAIARTPTSSGQFHTELSAELSALLYSANLRKNSQFPTSGRSAVLDLFRVQPFNWDYFLSQSLPQVLAQELICS